MPKTTEDKQSSDYYYSALSTQQLLLIDQLCVRYEHALKRDQLIPLEELLPDASTEIIKPLFTELLFLECNHRRRLGKRVLIDAYLQRFPEFETEIRYVWQELEASSSFFSTTADTPTEDAGVPLENQTNLSITGYHIIKRLARGGMGVVYHAKDIELNRTVAIKMLTSDLMSPEQLERFRTEARAISALHHPNIIQIYSVGEYHDQPYLVLEYAGAGTLKERLNEGPLPQDEALNILLTSMKTIKFIHQQGFLHRDLKPSNVLFDHKGNIKISDFGLAKDLSLDTEMTQPQTQMGTPAYMAPEQMDNRFGKTTELSDIYSLGMLMHTLLTGVTPYQGFSTPQLIQTVSSSKAVPNTELLKHRINKSLIRVCLRCLEKQPADRYPSVQALLDDLQRVQQGLKISALPLYKRYIKKGLTITAGVLLLSLIALWFSYQTDSKQQTDFYGMPVIGQLPGITLQALHMPYVGEQDFKVVTLLSPNLKELSNGPLFSPQGLALYQDRYLAVADTLNHRLLLIDLDNGHISQLSGSGHAAYSGDNQPADKADLNLPAGLDFDPNGNLYIADRGNHAIRKIDRAGMMHTISGGVTCRELVGAEVLYDNSLCYPSKVVALNDNRFYIADAFHRRIRLKEIDSSSAHAEYYFDQGLSEDQQAQQDFMPQPRNMVYANNRIYFIETATGKNAGSYLKQLNADDSLTTLNDRLLEPNSISADAQGNLYISDQSTYPLTRINTRTGQAEVLPADSLFADPKQHSITALSVDQQGRIFYSDAYRNSIHVIIPHRRYQQIPMQADDKQDRQRAYSSYMPESLDKAQLFLHINNRADEFFSNFAYSLGLHPYIHHSVDRQDRINLNKETLRNRDMLTLTCLFYSLSCGIEGNTLYVAADNKFASITDATPFKIENPLSFIKNHQAMPVHLQQAAEYQVTFKQGVINFIHEFFQSLSRQTPYEYELDASMDRFKRAKLDLNGTFKIGELNAGLVLWQKISLTYDEESGKLIVSAWGSED